jgi:transaldolase
LAYAAYQQVFEAEPRYTALRAAGARVQRPLWASTGVKNSAYPDTMYVAELVAPNTVSTIPEATLAAVADHGVISSDTMIGKAAQAQEVFDRLTAVGIDLPDVFAVLEHDGVSKFAASWSRALQR